VAAMVVEPLSTEVWKDLVSRQGWGQLSPFQHPEWVNHQIRSIPGAMGASLLFRFPGGVRAAMPLVALNTRLGYKRYWSSCHDEYGGLISDGELQDGELGRIYEYLYSHNRPIRVTPAPEVGITTVPTGWGSTKQSTHLLKLPGSHIEWFDKVIQKSCRTDIRKAEKSALSMDSGASAESINAYYGLHVMSASRWHDKRASEIGKFQALLSCPLSSLHIVRKNGEPAAGLITLHWRGYTVYYLGASNRNLAGYRPTDFGISEVVRLAIQEDGGVLNFGSSLGLDSLERFKEKFGAVKVYYETYYANTRRESFRQALTYYKRRLTSGLFEGDQG
jgi:hypothetical protein